VGCLGAATAFETLINAAGSGGAPAHLSRNPTISGQDTRTGRARARAGDHAWAATFEDSPAYRPGRRHRGARVRFAGATFASSRAGSSLG